MCAQLHIIARVERHEAEQSGRNDQNKAQGYLEYLERLDDPALGAELADELGVVVVGLDGLGVAARAGHGRGGLDEVGAEGALREVPKRRRLAGII